MHLSLWRDGEPAFPDAGDPRGLGLSPLAYSFVAGLLEHACGLQAVLAPTVNSYKRTGASATRSGATWSPRVGDLRRQRPHPLLRVPDGNRVELRGGDGSANPYLAAAAALAAGLDGVRRGLDPGEPGERPTSGPLPAHAAARRRGAGGRRGRRAAPSTPAGAGVADYFAELKREEFFDWHGQVSAWEIDRYLTAF